MDAALIEDIVRRALAEDLSVEGDITSRAVIAEGARADAIFVAREQGVISGTAFAAEVFRQSATTVEFTLLKSDGDHVQKGDRIATASGNAREILAAERSALNFLGHLSGIATLTSQYVEAIAPYKTQIVDTRKTTPGLRLAEKAAVAAGGGVNHRTGLFDGILIKDNHVAAAGGVANAVTSAKSAIASGAVPGGILVQVEVDTIDQLGAALKAGADAVLLDNMHPLQISECLSMIHDFQQSRSQSAGKDEAHVMTEASGGITLNNVYEYAKAGVDRISIGALTHSARSLDVSLEFTAE